MPWRFVSDHFPFFSWVMAVGEPAVNLPGSLFFYHIHLVVFNGKKTVNLGIYICIYMYIPYMDG